MTWTGSNRPPAWWYWHSNQLNYCRKWWELQGRTRDPSVVGKAGRFQLSAVPSSGSGARSNHRPLVWTDRFSQPGCTATSWHCITFPFCWLHETIYNVNIRLCVNLLFRFCLFEWLFRFTTLDTQESQAIGNDRSLFLVNDFPSSRKIVFLEHSNSFFGSYLVEAKNVEQSTLFCFSLWRRQFKFPNWE